MKKSFYCYGSYSFVEELRQLTNKYIIKMSESLTENKNRMALYLNPAADWSSDTEGAIYVIVKVKGMSILGIPGKVNNKKGDEEPKSYCG